MAYERRNGKSVVRTTFAFRAIDFDWNLHILSGNDGKRKGGNVLAEI